MKLTAILAVACLLVAAAYAVDPRMINARRADPYTIQDPETLEMTIEEVDPATLPKGKYDYLYEHVLRNLTNGVAIEPMASAIDWGMVVNVGKKIWEIVEKNQPTLQVQTSSASALPGGISDWKQMAGWQTPISRAYSITYTNLYTIKVVQFTFRVVFHYGGNYQGKGKYMTGITVIPSNIDVLWGYNFDCKVTVPEVLNSGTTANPVASAQVNLEWYVGTVIKKSKNTSSWYVKGDGSIKQLCSY